MKKILMGAAVTLFSVSTAFAQDYQVELGAAYLNGDVNGVDFDGIGLNAEVHFDKVNTRKGPLNEAAFLDKSSFANLTWITLDPDTAGADSADTTTIQGRFVLEKQLILEAGYTDLEDDDAIRLGLGMYLNDTLDAVVNYEAYDDADASSLGVDFHGVNKLNGNASVAFDFGFALLDVNDDTGYGFSAGADYYIDRNFSFGGSLSLESVDDADLSTFQVGVNYFVTPVVRVGADFITLGQDGDGDTLAINANVRF